jgi:transcription antitermination factor NusG
VIPLSRTGFRIGDRVRIVSGALSGQLGIYHGQSAHERVVVLLQLLGVSRVELRKDAIRPVT